MSGFPTLSPLLKVGWSTRPERRLLMLVRTNAEPFPGFTCWNSMISKGSPSTSIFRPFLNSDVSMTPAMAAAPYSEGARLGRAQSLKFGADARRGDAERVASLAVIAGGPEREHDEVLVGHQPHDGEHLVRVDAHLGDRAGLEELRGVLHLTEHRRVLDQGGLHVEIRGGVHLEVLDRDAVEAHDRARQGSIHRPDHLLQQGQEGHRADLAQGLLQETTWSRPGMPQGPPLTTKPPVEQSSGTVELRYTVTGKLTLLVYFGWPATSFPKIWKVTRSVWGTVSMSVLAPIAFEAPGWIRLAPTVLVSGRAPAAMVAWMFWS